MGDFGSDECEPVVNCILLSRSSAVDEDQRQRRSLWGLWEWVISHTLMHV